MRMQDVIRPDTRFGLASMVAACMFISGRGVFAFGQGPVSEVSVARSLAQAAQQAPTQAQGPVRRLTVDEAVSMALESNLGIRAERFGPLIQDRAVAQARSVWVPVVYNSFGKTSTSTPPDSFLSGAAPTITSSAISNTTGVQQTLPFGANYDVRWTASNSTTTAFTSFNPRLGSQLDLSISQPLLRGFGIDTNRRQVWSAENLRTIADLQLRERITTTTRNVRNSYWDLAYAIGNLQVAQQSLDLARESLRNNQRRVEVGTMAPIDIVEAEAEVARNEESVIVADSAIKSAEDVLRIQIMTPDQPDYWTLRLEPAEAAVLRPVTINVQAAVSAALENRTDILASKKQLENTMIDVRYYANQRLPGLDLSASYGAVGLGGTQLIYGEGGFPPPVIGEATRSFGSVLKDVFSAAYPSWSVGVLFSYPLGTSNADAGLAGARLAQTQAETQLQNLELQVSTAVREVGRRVETNLKRVETTQRAREFAERRLDAVQKKFTLGLSSNFEVFQAQRDLAVARFNELRATIDYNKALVDFEAVQNSPLR